MSAAFVRVCRVLAWLVLALCVFFQVVAVLGIRANGIAYDTAPLLTATVLLVLAVVLFFALPRGKLVPLLATVALAAVFVVLALDLHATFSPASPRADSGLTWWRTVYRHLLPTTLPVLLFPVWWDDRARRLERRAAREAETPPSVLGDAPHDTRS